MPPRVISITRFFGWCEMFLLISFLFGFHFGYWPDEMIQKNDGTIFVAGMVCGYIIHSSILAIKTGRSLITASHEFKRMDEKNG